MYKKNVDLQALFQDYRDGLTMAQLGEKYGLKSYRAVSLRLRSIPGFVVRREPRQLRGWPEERRQQAVAFYLSGWSMSKIGRLLKANNAHIRRVLEESGVPLRTQSEQQMGANTWNYKGRVRQGGYWKIRLPDHPGASFGYVPEHRLVMEGLLGRLLTKKEVVHHKDGNGLNNDPSNLQLFSSNGEHLAFDLKGRVPQWSEDGKRRLREGFARAAETRRKKSRSKIDAPQ